MVLFYRQHIIPALVDDGPGDLPLASQGVSGYDATADVNLPQQVRDGRYLVGLLPNLDLPKADTVIHEPGTYDMELIPWAPTAQARATQDAVGRVVTRPLDRLAIKGYHTLIFIDHRTDPFAELTLQDIRPEKAEKAVERIRRGDRFQVREYASEIGELATAEKSYVVPCLGVTKDSREGDIND